MITAKEAFRMESILLYALDPEYAGRNTKELKGSFSEEDRVIFKAYDAVQELRLYLEEKESHEKNT